MALDTGKLAVGQNLSRIRARRQSAAVAVEQDKRIVRSAFHRTMVEEVARPRTIVFAALAGVAFGIWKSREVPEDAGRGKRVAKVLASLFWLNRVGTAVLAALRGTSR